MLSVVLLTPQLLPRQVFQLALLMVLMLAAVAGLTLRGLGGRGSARGLAYPADSSDP